MGKIFYQMVLHQNSPSTYFMLIMLSLLTTIALHSLFSLSLMSDLEYLFKIVFHKTIPPMTYITFTDLAASYFVAATFVFGLSTSKTPILSVLLRCS